MLRSLASVAVVPPGLHSHRRRLPACTATAGAAPASGAATSAPASAASARRPRPRAIPRRAHLSRPPSRRRPSMALLHPLALLLAEPRTRVTSVYVSGVQDGIDLLLHDVFDSGPGMRRWSTPPQVILLLGNFPLPPNSEADDRSLCVLGATIMLRWCGFGQPFLHTTPRA